VKHTTAGKWASNDLKCNEESVVSPMNRDGCGKGVPWDVQLSDWRGGQWAKFAAM
jgi:hypothetical protein